MPDHAEVTLATGKEQSLISEPQFLGKSFAICYLPISSPSVHSCKSREKPIHALLVLFEGFDI